MSWLQGVGTSRAVQRSMRACAGGASLRQPIIQSVPKRMHCALRPPCTAVKSHSHGEQATRHSARQITDTTPFLLLQTPACAAAAAVAAAAARLRLRRVAGPQRLEDAPQAAPPPPC